MSGRANSRDEGCCGGDTVQNWLDPPLLALYILVAGLVIVCVVFAGIWLANPPPGHLSASSEVTELDGHRVHVVNLHATESHDVLEIGQASNFKGFTNFESLIVQNMTVANITAAILLLTNQTTGSDYDLDQAIEALLLDVDALDAVLGMPELQAFLATYYNETLTLMRRRSLTRGPNVVTFLYDTQNNITSLQTTLATVNNSLYVNANYAFYPAAATAIPTSPTTALVNLNSSGAFALQVGTTLTSNQVSVGKAGLYQITFNVGVSQPASAVQQTVLLMIDSSTISSANINWDGAATGFSSVSQTVIVPLALTDVVKIAVTATAGGSSINVAGTSLGIYNIS